jgi:uncharacterized repeat protein (TIGR01451 family)
METRIAQANLSLSWLQTEPVPQAGDSIEIRVNLKNTGLVATQNNTVTLTLPPELTHISGGDIVMNNKVIFTNHTVGSNDTTSLTFVANIDDTIVNATVLPLETIINWDGQMVEKTFAIIVNGFQQFLPLLMKE